MVLASLLVLLLPLQVDETMDREGVRSRLRKIALSDQGWKENRALFLRLSQHALAELPLMLAAERDHVFELLQLYRHAVLLKEPLVTPAALLNFARSGSKWEHVEAASIAFLIRDERAIALLLEGLRRMADGYGTEGGHLELCLVEGAGRSRSPEAGRILVELLQHPQGTRLPVILDALGDLGYEPALKDLRRLVSVKTGAVGGRAELAISKIELLAASDRTARLVEHLRPRTASNEAWQGWALDQILRFRITEAADALRREYDAGLWGTGAPACGTTVRAYVLHAIRKLGGTISAEEEQLLHDLGRLPPAKPAEPDEVELLPRFANGVWRRN